MRRRGGRGWARPRSPAGSARRPAGAVVRSRAGPARTGRNVDPSDDRPSAVTRLKPIAPSSASASPPSGSIAASTPASSRTWVGGASSPSSTITPQYGRIGRQAPDRVDDRGGPRPGRHDHGARAHDAAAGVDGDGGAGARTTRAPPSPSRIRAPRRTASAANARHAAAGATGKPMSRRTPARPSARPGSSRRRSSGPTYVARKSGLPVGDRRGLRPEPRLVPAEGEDPGGLVGEAEVAFRRPGRELGPDLVGEPAVAREGLEVQRAQDRVRRIPDRAGVASRRARGDLVSLEQLDADATPRELGGERRADDAAPDDRDVGRRPPPRHGRRAQATPAPVAISASSPTRRSTSAAVL